MSCLGLQPLLELFQLGITLLQRSLQCARELLQRDQLRIIWAAKEFLNFLPGAVQVANLGTEPFDVRLGVSDALGVLEEKRPNLG